MSGPTIPLTVLFVTFGFTMYYLLKTRHLERMARIEHGLQSDVGGENSLLLNLGLFLVFLGLGLLSAFAAAKIFQLPEYLFVPGFLLLSGGAGLLVAYRQSRKSNS